MRDRRAETTFGNVIAGLVVAGLVVVVVTATPLLEWVEDFTAPPTEPVFVELFESDTTAPWFPCVDPADPITLTIEGDFGTITKTWSAGIMKVYDGGRLLRTPVGIEYRRGASVDLTLEVGGALGSPFYLSGYVNEEGADPARFVEDFCPLS